jgi:hypothetical protein
MRRRSFLEAITTYDGKWHRLLRYEGLSSAPIRWLITGGVFLIAAIAIGTTIMVDNFRERAINSNERELENTVLLLAISINSLKISRSSSRTLQRKSIRTD